MPKSPRSHIDDLRGASRLAIEATRGITSLAKEVHDTIGSGPAVLGRPLAIPTRAVTKIVYGGVSGTTGLVGAGIDAALAKLAPLLQHAEPTHEHEAVIAALNGVLGDYLEETGNPLAIPMCFRRDGATLELTTTALRRDLPNAGPRLLLMVHGSSMNDRQWRRGGHDHGTELAAELGRTRVDLHYNTGRHISTNGADFSTMLDALVGAWPVAVEDIVVVTHSMGGLVTRSACDHAEGNSLPWRNQLSAVVFLGTPHHGAPLERAGNWVDVLLGVSRYSAPFARLGKIRSAGVTDLRYALLRDDDWQGRDRFARTPPPPRPLPLPVGVGCFAVAGVVSEGLAGRLPGDGLVPVDSALGRHPDPARDLGLPDDHVCVVPGTSHLDLLSSPDVLEVVRSWL